MTKTTEIRIDEYGDETHESWVSIIANRAQTAPSKWLFDSEIPHQHIITVKVQRVTRRRDLNRDWLHGRKTLLELAMSQAQWGAFVSSFGSGSVVPATLEFLTGVGRVPQAPVESRFDESHKEVREAGDKALNHIVEDYEKVMEAFENGGKEAMREALRDLGFAIKNAPANMEFAAKSLTEHVENVVTKARADIEGMALAAVERGELAEPITLPQLEQGGDK